MTTKEYTHILERLIGDVEEEKDLEEKVGGFLAYVAENNDAHLLGKIYTRLETAWRKNVRNVRIETGMEGGKSKELREKIRKFFREGNIATRVTEKVNPRLISGVKINVDDNYLIEASLESALNQMFNERGFANNANHSK